MNKQLVKMEQMDRRAGFTAVEIMLVVATIALLAALALPAFLKSRNNVQDTKFMADLRVGTDAFEQHALFEGIYPASAAVGVVPAGMADYLTDMRWSEASSIGGSWDWDNATVGTDEGVSIISPSADAARMIDIDERMDDGDPVTGLFRRRSDSTGYIYLTGS